MATSTHPRALAVTPALDAWPRALALPRLEVVVAAVGASVLASAVTIATLAGMLDTGARVAGLTTAVVGVLLVVVAQVRRRWRRVGHGRRQAHVDARTAVELQRVAANRWLVRHDVPIGEGRTAHLVADDAEVHLVVAVWTPPQRAALHLRSAVAAATCAAQHLGELDVARGRTREIVPTVVAWGRAAADARARQAPSPDRATILLPGELWTWRIERATSRGPASVRAGELAVDEVVATA